MRPTRRWAATWVWPWQTRSYRPPAISSRKQPAVVAVEHGNLPARQLQFTLPLVTGMAAGPHGGPQLRQVVIDVAEDEMGRPGVKQTDDFRRADVAAVDQLLHFQTFEHPHGRPDVFQVAVRVADDADSHGVRREPLRVAFAGPVAKRYEETP